METIHRLSGKRNNSWFKSYYVVWKLDEFENLEQTICGLNRTM